MLHVINSEQLFKVNKDILWKFISSPYNLATITPEYMKFQVLGDLTDTMYQGQVIQYHVRPLLGIRLSWVTEITHVKDGEYFVDEQRFGPYAFWHHQHRLIETNDGVLMKDIVHYKAPFGVLGRALNSLVIKKQLDDIFSYRKTKLDSIFNKHD